MKRIIIVDDEYLVRLGIKTIIDWNEHGFTIAGEASNGREALELFDRIGADVILTDIKMPVMDGIALTRAIKAKNRAVQIIILSHYDEFEYAREAVNLGAFRYILKSELNKTTLLDVLKSLFNMDNTESAAGAAKNSGGNDETARLKGYLETLLDAWNNPSEAGAPPVPAGARVRVLCASCRYAHHEGQTTFAKAVAVFFSDAFPGAVIASAFREAWFRMALLLPESASAENSEDRIVRAGNQIVKNVRQYYDDAFFIGISSPAAAEGGRRLWPEARRALDLTFFSEKNFVSVFSGGGPPAAAAVPAVSYTRLQETIETNRKEEMLACIQTVFRELRLIKNYERVRKVFNDFLSAGKFMMEKFNLRNDAALGEQKFNQEILDDLPFIGDVEFHIYSIFLSLLAGKQGGEITYSYIVKTSIAFIQQHYAEAISLNDAAAAAEVSHSYLSFIFKQETGINFNTWLTNYRVEQAKKLLRETNMRIYEVAARIGFANPYYFSKVFRESTGRSCKEYRDMPSADNAT